METKNTSTLFIATTKMLPIWKRKGVVAREGSFLWRLKKRRRNSVVFVTANMFSYDL